jgi:hypothetical protein
VTGASGYTAALYNAAGTLVGEQDVTGTTASASGLPKGTYHVNVWANGGSSAPAHSTVNVTLSS